jgi:cell division inhibitor SulA
MPKYLIEREIPGAGNMTPQQLQAVSQTSCGVLQKLGPQIQWLHSYVTGDKIYCVYIAPNEEMVREHAQQGGFPANRISEIKTMIDPTTAETLKSATGLEAGYRRLVGLYPDA